MCIYPAPSLLQNLCLVIKSLPIATALSSLYCIALLLGEEFQDVKIEKESMHKLTSNFLEIHEQTIKDGSRMQYLNFKPTVTVHLCMISPPLVGFVPFCFFLFVCISNSSGA